MRHRWVAAHNGRAHRCGCVFRANRAVGRPDDPVHAHMVAAADFCFHEPRETDSICRSDGHNRVPTLARLTVCTATTYSYERVKLVAVGQIVERTGLGRRRAIRRTVGWCGS